MYEKNKEVIIDEAISKEDELKLAIRSDFYYTIEGVTGNKAFARGVLSRHFDTLWEQFGDSEDLCNAIYKEAGLVVEDNWVKLAS